MNGFQTYRCGSVLMEFVVVLPIYLVLFGGMMMLGDLAIHATKLVSNERMECLVANHLAGNQKLEASVVHYADMKISCPFAVSTGVKVKETYSLPEWTRGHLAYAFWFFERALPTKNDIDNGSLYQPGGSVVLHSKSVKNNEMIYFTLHRYDYSRGESTCSRTWRSNGRHSSDLLTLFDQNGKRAWNAVATEGYLQRNSNLNKKTQRTRPTVVGCTDGCRYVSYADFEPYR